MQHIDFIMPMSGQLLNLADIPDPHFSEGTLGKGFAIQLMGEVVVSPIAGCVIATFPSGHAFIIRDKQGIEVLIHVGLHSAKKAEAFRMQVKQNQLVKAGDILTYVDIHQFAPDPQSRISPIVFNQPNLEIQLNKQGYVQVGEQHAITINHKLNA